MSLACVSLTVLRNTMLCRTHGGIFTTPGEAYTTPVEMWVKALGGCSSAPARRAFMHSTSDQVHRPLATEIAVQFRSVQDQVYRWFRPGELDIANPKNLNLNLLRLFFASSRAFGGRALSPHHFCTLPIPHDQSTITSSAQEIRSPSQTLQLRKIRLLCLKPLHSNMH